MKVTYINENNRKCTVKNIVEILEHRNVDGTVEIWLGQYAGFGKPPRTIHFFENELVEINKEEVLKMGKRRIPYKELKERRYKRK